MSRILNESDMKNIIAGATVLGGGGGGSASGGFDLLELFKKNNPDKKVSVTMLDPDELDAGKYAAVTAGMGAPKALIGKDFTPYAVNSYNALKELAASMNPPKELEYTCAVEMGGFNTFVPMLISLLTGAPFVDGDGAGRAVPALDTLLLHVNGCDTSPLAMADHKNNCVQIKLAEPKDASTAEVIGRNICIAFDMIAGLSGWMISKKEIKERIGNNTVTYALEIGEALSRYDGSGNVYEYLHTSGNLPSKAVGSGEVIYVETKTAGGFDYGVVHIKCEDNSKIDVAFQNENLVIMKNGEVLMTAPDIITLYDKNARMPITNADVAKGMIVDVGVVKVDERWWNRGEEEINQIWQPYFKNVEYHGPIVRF